MDQDDGVGFDRERGSRQPVHHRGTFRERQRRLGTDAAAGGQPEMHDDDVRAGTRHGGGVGLVEDIGRGQKVLLARQGDHLDLLGKGHAGLLEILAEGAVDEADGGKVLHAGKADALHLIEEDIHLAERVGGADPGQHRCALDDRQYLARHLHDDRVGIAIGHQTGKAAAPGHAVAA